MKTIFAGLLLAAALAAVATSTVINGRGADTRASDRRPGLRDLRDGAPAPELRDARFAGPRNAPIQINSPTVLLEPAKRFADAVTVFAAGIGASAGPELGAAWLAGRVARMADPAAADKDAAPQPKGAALRAPLPTPRPDTARPAQGVLSAALEMLEKAGLDAMSPAGAPPPDAAALADKAGALATPVSGTAFTDPGRFLPDTHPDRAPGRGA